MAPHSETGRCSEMVQNAAKSPYQSLPEVTYLAHPTLIPSLPLEILYQEMGEWSATGGWFQVHPGHFLQVSLPYRHESHHSPSEAKSA